VGEGPIELEPLGTPEPPPLPGCVRVDDTADDAVDALLSDLLAYALEAVESRQRFDLAVPVDRSLGTLWMRCMLDPDLRPFPWAQTHVWIPGDVDRVWLHESLVSPAGIPPGQVRSGPVDAAVCRRLDCVVADASKAARVIAGDPAVQRASRLLFLTEAKAVAPVLAEAQANPAPWQEAAPRLHWYL